MRCGCDSDTDSNRAMPMACETSKTQTLWNAGPFFFPRFSLLVVRNWSWKCLNEAISRCDSCDKKTLRFVCPSCTRDTDGIAAKLLRCGIASEVLRRNMPLRAAKLVNHYAVVFSVFPHFYYAWTLFWEKNPAKPRNWFENAPACYRAPRWPDPEFHEKYRKNTPRPEILDSQNFPRKIPRKHRKNTPKIPKMTVFGIFSVFCGYFLGGPKFRPGGYFFAIFCGNSGSGHLGAL